MIIIKLFIWFLKIPLLHPFKGFWNKYLLCTIFDIKYIHLGSNEHLYIAKTFVPQECILLYLQKYGEIKLAEAWKGIGDILSIHWKILVYVNRTCVPREVNCIPMCLLILTKKEQIWLLIITTTKDPMGL